MQKKMVSWNWTFGYCCEDKILHFILGSSNARFKIFKENGTLVIHSTKTADRGEYICEVVTIGFEPVSSKPATISVIGKFSIFSTFSI